MDGGEGAGGVLWWGRQVHLQPRKLASQRDERRAVALDGVRVVALDFQRLSKPRRVADQDVGPRLLEAIAEKVEVVECAGFESREGTEAARGIRRVEPDDPLAAHRSAEDDVRRAVVANAGP